MPAVIVATMIALFALPITSLIGSEASARFLDHRGVGMVIFLLGYWVIPICGIGAIAARHRAALFFFYATWAVILVFAVWRYSAVESAGNLGCALAAVISLSGSLIAGLSFGRDELAPYLSRSKRAWRRAPRFFANTKIVVRLPESGARHPAILNDCSLSGLSLALDASATRGLLSQLSLGTRIEVDLAIPGVVLEGKLMRQTDALGVTQIGLAVEDKAKMSTLVAEMNRGAHPVKHGRWRWLLAGTWLLAMPGAAALALNS